MSDGVCMLWSGHVEKLLEVIDRLSRLALEIVLGGSDAFLINIVCLLSIIIANVASSNRDPLLVVLWPLLTAFGTSLSAFTGNLGWWPSAATTDHLPITLDIDRPDLLFTIGVPSGNVKQLLHGIRLITSEVMH
jgi:hypothetical protein